MSDSIPPSEIAPAFELVLTPESSGSRYWKDLWAFRELLFFLAWRDILVRYKQTAIGITWAFGRPLISIVVFTIVFGKLAKLPSGGVPYPLLVLAGLLPWQFFSSAFVGSGESLVANASMISKVYFPRLIIPLSTIIVSLIDFAVSGSIFIALALWYDEAPTLRILLLPFSFLLALAFAVGSGVWVAALNVKYRDFRIIVPFVVQFGLYISPVAFSSDVIPQRWRILYSLNPMVGVIDGFRWSLLDSDATLNLASIAVSLIVSIGLLATGIWYFRSTERNFADSI